ncbi:MAG: preprotein translocase subunit SecY [Nitrososphaerota archaeon]|nr:preprotein translocase subunit SecY [Nitrososphaerota archaeon]MDG7038510.1 preprotein translocase subunit SecY [Nitrososphaerota archaeon]MDG7040778.1 preprotein translocase subunit SecY [Nitrososphaerota archaeon]MDG7041903.1 preprotein translocase subunit SecY [Nitrososphaerota archaeon]MDG7044093.1 preprotein translocase subunit SecY [Nitrososphaerota archaeon]
MRARDVISRISSVLPEVPKPIRAPSFNEKLLWTGLALVLYLIMSQIPLFGVTASASNSLYLYQVIFAANIGTLMTLGIGPIVTAGLIAQILAGSDLMKLNFSMPDDQRFFSAFTKVLTFVFIIVEAIFYIFSGILGVSVTGNVALIVILELIFASIAVFLLDQLVQKGWGIGSGISLFILAGVAVQFMLDAFSPLPVNGQYFGYVPYAINETIHRTLNALSFRAASMPSLVGLVSTIGFILLILYLEGVRIELPITSTKYKGFSGTYPIKLLYVSNIPVILVAALIADLQFFVTILSRYASVTPYLSWLAVMVNGKVEGGILYYISTPQPLPYTLQDPLQMTTYILFVTLLSVLFARLWVDVSGMSASKAAENLLGSEVQVPGFRSTKSSVTSILNKYIPAVTLLSGLIIGILASTSAVLDVFGTGIGILLAIDISINYYQTLVKEQLEVIMPRLGEFLGRK